MSDIQEINRSENVAVAGKHEPAVATSAGRDPLTRAGGEASVAVGSSRRRNFLQPWDEATIATVRQWAGEGLSQREIGRRLGLVGYTVERQMRRAGITPAIQKPRTDEMLRGAEVLRAHFSTAPDLREVLRLYREARGNDRPTMKSMRQHARSLDLVRPDDAELRGAQLGAKTIKQLWHAANVEAAPRVQAALDVAGSVDRAARDLRMSNARIKKMIAAGLVTAPPPLPRPVAKPRVFTPRVPKPKAPKPPKAAKPKVLPKSWVRSAAPTPQPKVTYQTVEAWLAAGGRITQCPAAAVHVTTATLGEGRDVIRQHAAAMAGDDGNWVSRAKKKMGRFQFGAGK